MISIPLFQSFNPLFSLRLNLKLLLTSTFYRVERYLHVIQLMKSIIGRNVLMQFLNSLFEKFRQKQVQNKLILSSVSVFVATEYFIPDEKYC